MQPPWSVGKILSVVVLVLAIVFLALAKLPLIGGGLIALLAVAVLLL